MPTQSSVSTPRIGPIDLDAERRSLGGALEEALVRVLESGQFVLGSEVASFERDFAALHGVVHGIGVASGTDALILALKALGVEPGDHVVTSPFTFFASAGTIAWLGARPVFADVDPRTGLIDVAGAEAAIDAKTTCLLPVHLYGQLADVRALRELADRKGLRLLEDAAQAHGARRDGVAAGELGDATAFSFYPTKNLGAAGEGGMVITPDDAIAERLGRLRDHGSVAKYTHAEIGTNSRLPSLQAALLNVKLPHLATWNEKRRTIAARYDAAFASSTHLAPLTVEPDAQHVYHQYALRVLGDGARDCLQSELAKRGISTAVHYPTPVHFQEALAHLGHGPGDFPHAEALCKEVLCLPVHPFLSTSDVDRVVENVLDAVSHAH